MVVCGAIGVGLLLVKVPSLLAIAAVVIVWALSPPSMKLAIVIAVTFLPFTVGDVGSVPDVLVSELLIPMALLFGLSMSIRDRRSLFPRESLLYLIAAGVYLSITFGHLLWGPLGLSTLGGIGGAGSGLRAHYDLVLGPAAFLAAMWIGGAVDLRAKGLLILRFLLVVALAACVLRVASYYAGFEMPLLGQTFRYGVLSRIVSGGVADRIGGLAEAAGLGLACLFGLWFGGEGGSRLVWPGAVFGVAVVLSGGRTFALGVIIAFGVLIAALSDRARVRLTVMSAIVAGLGSIGVVFAGYTRQFDRLLAYTGGLSTQDFARYSAISIQLEEFQKSPLVGKGIGTSTVPVSDEFVAEQVSRGGHSTYTSILANQGAIGLLSYLVIAAGPPFRAFREIRRQKGGQLSPVEGIFVFVLFFGVAKLAQFVAGGNGYADLTPYVCAALVTIGVVRPEGGVER